MFSRTVIPLLLFSWACSEQPATSPNSESIRASISDAVHEGGNAQFYFLPPLVDAPQPTGIFDASLLPYTVVDICRLDPVGCPTIAQFTSTAGATCGLNGANIPVAELLRIDPEAEAYLVNWHTTCAQLETAATYRIRILVAGTELGHVDLPVVASAKDLAAVPGEEFGLVQGRTLPIKFRIEQGAVFVLGPTGGAISAFDEMVKLVIPDGALGKTIGITVARATDASSEAIEGTVYDLGPNGTSFLKPADLVIQYDPLKVPQGVDETTLRIHTFTPPDDLQEEFNGSVDVISKVVQAKISGFSIHLVAPWRPIARISVTPATAELQVGQTVQLNATAVDATDHMLNRLFTWASDNPPTVTVDQTGLASAIAGGTAAVTARSQGVGGSAAVAVSTPVSIFGDYQGTMTLSVIRTCFVPTGDNCAPRSAGPAVSDLHLQQDLTRKMGVLGQFAFPCCTNPELVTPGFLTGTVLNGVLTFSVEVSPNVWCPGTAESDGQTVHGDFVCVVENANERDTNDFQFSASRVAF